MIFLSELTALDHEIETIQKLLVSLEAQRTVYQEVAGKAEGYLMGLSQFIQQVEGLGENAIASFQDAVLHLFTDGGNRNTEAEQNQPTDLTPDTDPTPQTFEDWQQSPAQGAYFGDKPEPLTRRTQWQEPEQISSPNSPLLTSLPPTSDEDVEKPFIEFIQTDNPAVAYFRKVTGEISAVYIGGTNKSRLQSWADWLFSKGYLLKRTRPRDAKRLAGVWKYEIKLPAMPMSKIEELVRSNYRKMPPRGECASAMPPKYEPKYPIHNYQPGDQVVLFLTPSETWQLTTSPAADGKAFAVSLLDGRRDLIALDECQLVESAVTRQTKNGTSSKQT